MSYFLENRVEDPPPRPLLIGHAETFDLKLLTEQKSLFATQCSEHLAKHTAQNELQRTENAGLIAPHGP